VNAAAVASYESAGYRIERVYAQMVRSFELTGPPAPAELDPAYTLRLADQDADAAVLHQLNERAFDQEFGHEPETLEDFTRGYLTFSQFDPAGTLIVETAGRDPAGCLVGWRPLDHPHGYVASLAVDPEHRRRGLARAMLLSAFAAIHAAGLPAAELHVASDNPRALDLYRGVGMHEGERINNYIRAV
jgi:ribosomal protein S18 acetylase RimI-like enzyme